MDTKHWISARTETGDGAITFSKRIDCSQPIRKATLECTALGIYRAKLNGEKIGRQVLTPGFTSYRHRVQFQTYDLTDRMQEHNLLAITVAPGWAVGRFGSGRQMFADRMRVNSCLHLIFTDGSEATVSTDETWQVTTDCVTFAGVYDGETVDRTHIPQSLGYAVADVCGYLPVPQIGEDILEQEIFEPVELIRTPKGETVLDFGQNLCGYVSLTVRGHRGERVVLSHAEVLDMDGNFYTDNYRSAKNCLTFILDEGENHFKPEFSFQGFRYIRIDEYPDTELRLSDFRAIAVYSDLKRIGHFSCGNEKINQLYRNILWGQRSNYLDLPTDCPQRDERIGWTGDTQVFCRTGALQYDVLRFFRKWLGDLRAEQREDGAVYGSCPESFLPGHTRISAGWGDAATIVPWTLYEQYGDKTILAENYEMMRKWVEYQRAAGSEETLWLGGFHYGDWLAMDTGGESYLGATSTDLIASAFYAHSVDLLIRAGEVLGKDMREYRDLHERILASFRSYFMESGMPKETLPFTEKRPAWEKDPTDAYRRGITQTSLALILAFDLCRPEEREKLADKLEELIADFGGRMSTGFLGTPYLLHALSSCGRNATAYHLLFEEQVPSWLYSVNHGATTMWEHWNSLREDGSFWSTDMNSFNHYAYGAVGDWLYGTAAGIHVLPGGEGYRRILLEPIPNRKLRFVNCSLKTPLGRLESNWYERDGKVHFAFCIPTGCETTVRLPDGSERVLTGGRYCMAISKREWSVEYET